jgi:hypothetical protein
MKILGAALILSAGIASPIFAAGQEGGGPIGPGNGLTPQPGPIYHQSWAYHRGAYNQWNGHYDPEFQHNNEELGFSGRDRSPPRLSSAHGG